MSQDSRIITAELNADSAAAITSRPEAGPTGGRNLLNVPACHVPTGEIDSLPWCEQCSEAYEKALAQLAHHCTLPTEALLEAAVARFRSVLLAGEEVSCLDTTSDGRPAHPSQCDFQSTRTALGMQTRSLIAGPDPWHTNSAGPEQP